MSLDKTKNSLYISALTRSALIAAIIFVMTKFLMVPIPGGFGYVHLGDGAVFLAAALLPQPFAFVTAAVGASLADIGPYAIYIPITFITKAAMTLAFSHKSQRLIFLRNIMALGVGVIINSVFYYLGECIIYSGFAAPLANIPFNLLQSAVGAVLFALVGVFLDANPRVRKIIRGR